MLCNSIILEENKNEKKILSWEIQTFKLRLTGILALVYSTGFYWHPVIYGYWELQICRTYLSVHDKALGDSHSVFRYWHSEHSSYKAVYRYYTFFFFCVSTPSIHHLLYSAFYKIIKNCSPRQPFCFTASAVGFADLCFLSGKPVQFQCLFDWW